MTYKNSSIYYAIWFNWRNIMDFCLWFWRISSILLHCRAWASENTSENLNSNCWQSKQRKWPKAYADKDRTLQKTSVRLVLVKLWSVGVQEWRKFSCTNFDLRASSLGHKGPESNSKSGLQQVNQKYWQWTGKKFILKPWRDQKRRALRIVPPALDF